MIVMKHYLQLIQFSAAEVLSLLEAEGELDDRDEVFVEGSDEDFAELEELEDNSSSKIETREEINGKYFIF